MDRRQSRIPVASEEIMVASRGSSVEEVIVEDDAEINTDNIDSSSSQDSLEQNINIYEKEWALITSDDSMKKIRQQAMNGLLRRCPVRSLFWRLLLGVLSGEHPELWTMETNQTRNHYLELLTKFRANPWMDYEVLDAQVDNPLSQNSQSQWNQYFCDQELRNVIKMDVLRTFPGVVFFRNPEIQDTMIKILFYYAREHPSICYRQGMHEILAPILFVVHWDYKRYSQTKEADQVRTDHPLDGLLDFSHVESDTYALFERVMFGIQGSYQISNVEPSNTGSFPAKSTSSSPVSEVLHQLDWIKEHLLAQSDPELYRHLEQKDVALPLFGIRWLRVLFGREFPLQDLLVLWDAIFSDGYVYNTFELVNYIVLSMLMAIREQLLSSDHTACLTILMKYPAMQVSKVIEHAMELRNPKAHDEVPPQSVASHLTSSVATQVPSVSKTQHNLDKKRKSETKSLTNRIKRFSLSSTSLLSQQTTSTSDSSSIIEGFMLDDPSVVRNELRQCRTVMALAQLKLAKYHSVLEQCVPHSNIAAQQSLTGIQELCSLLDLHRPSPSASLSSMEVEPAYEVGEVQPTPSTTPTPANLPPPSSEVDMTVFRKSQ